MTNDNLTDFQLIQSCLRGDKESFGELISRYKNLVYSIIVRMVSQTAIYDDLAQEIFIKVYVNLDKYSPDYKFSTWLIRIATNHIIDYRRKNKIEYVPLESTEYSLSTHKSSEDTVMENENCRYMDMLINNLPEMYRLPLVLYHQQGMSYDEIAKGLNISLSKVKNRIYRGRKILKEEYSRYLGDDKYEM